MDTLVMQYRYGLRTDRATYLALALIEHMPLATVDEKLRQIARESGVQVL